jgi:flagellar hook-length control protein FliK
VKVDPKQAANAPQATGDQPASGGADKRASFNKALDKARERDQAGETGKAEQAVAGQAAGTAALLARDGPVEGAQAAHAVTDPRLIEGLVREIVVMTRGAESQEVTIQFDSRTLDGLRVHLERDKGELSVRFVTRSEEATKLINANVDQLAHALQAKGLPLAAIQVQGVGRREETRRYHQRENRQGGQGGGKQGR